MWELSPELLSPFQVPPDQPYTSPSQSLANQAEFSEEVTKISNGVTDNTMCVNDHAMCVTDEEKDCVTTPTDYIFPQIIFDNLTDDDNIGSSHKKNG